MISLSRTDIQGATLLARQYLTEGFYPSWQRNAADAFTPMGALLKAIAVNSAKPLSGDYQRTGSGSALRDNMPPNFEYGFGLLSLDTTLLLEGHSNPARALYLDGDFDNMSVMGNRQFKDYVFAVPEGEAASVRVTMVYQDAPAMSMSRVTLVNDLDVSLIDGGRLSNNKKYFPNNRPRRDAINNVEHISVVGLVGPFTVRVAGYSVPMGPQPYALVVSGSSFSLRETKVGNLEPLSPTTSTPATEEPRDVDEGDRTSDSLDTSGDDLPMGMAFFFGGVGVAVVAFVGYHAIAATKSRTTMYE
jgi:hypothetical protein